MDLFLYRKVEAWSKHKLDRDRVVYKSDVKYQWVLYKQIKWSLIPSPTDIVNTQTLPGKLADARCWKFSSSGGISNSAAKFSTKASYIVDKWPQYNRAVSEFTALEMASIILIDLLAKERWILQEKGIKVDFRLVLLEHSPDNYSLKSKN